MSIVKRFVVTHVWQVDAESEEDAVAMIIDGDAELLEEVIEVEEE